MATIGRLMKNFDMTSPARRFSNKRLGIYFRAGAHLSHALRHHAFVWFEALGDDPLAADMFADLDGANIHLVVGVHNRNLVSALQLGHRTDHPSDDAYLTYLHTIRTFQRGIGTNRAECRSRAISLIVREISTKLAPCLF